MPSSESFEAVAREYAETQLRDIAHTLPADVVRRESVSANPTRRSRLWRVRPAPTSS